MSAVRVAFGGHFSSRGDLVNSERFDCPEYDPLICCFIPCEKMFVAANDNDEPATATIVGCELVLIHQYQFWIVMSSTSDGYRIITVVNGNDERVLCN